MLKWYQAGQSLAEVNSHLIVGQLMDRCHHNDSPWSGFDIFSDVRQLSMMLLPSPVLRGFSRAGLSESAEVIFCAFCAVLDNCGSPVNNAPHMEETALATILQRPVWEQRERETTSKVMLGGAEPESLGLVELT